MEEIAGHMAQMAAVIQALRNDNMRLQQQQQQHETLLQTATTGRGQNAQMERLIGVLTDQLRVLSARRGVNSVDVKGVGKPSVFQHDESKSCEWAKQIEGYQIGIEPHLKAMLTWASEKETENLTEHDCGQVLVRKGHPAEQVDGCAQVVVQLGTDWRRGEVHTSVLIH